MIIYPLLSIAPFDIEPNIPGKQKEVYATFWESDEMLHQDVFLT